MKKYMLLPLLASSLMSASATLHVTPKNLQNLVNTKNHTTLQAYLNHTQDYIFTNLQESEEIINIATAFEEGIEQLAKNVDKTSWNDKQATKSIIEQFKNYQKETYALQNIIQKLPNNAIKRAYQQIMSDMMVLPLLTWKGLAQKMAKISSYLNKTIEQARQEIQRFQQNEPVVKQLEKYRENSTQLLTQALTYFCQKNNNPFTLTHAKEIAPYILETLHAYQIAIMTYRPTNWLNQFEEKLTKLLEKLSTSAENYTYYQNIHESFARLTSQLEVNDKTITTQASIMPTEANERITAARNMYNLFKQRKKLLNQLINLQDRNIFFNVPVFTLCARFNNITNSGENFKKTIIAYMQDRILGEYHNYRNKEESFRNAFKLLSKTQHNEIKNWLEAFGEEFDEIVQAPEFELSEADFKFINFIEKKPKEALSIFLFTNRKALLKILQESQTLPARAAKPATDRLTQQQMQEQIRIEQEKIRVAQELTADLTEIQKLLQEKGADSLTQLPKILALFEKVYRLTHNPINPAMKDQLITLYNQAVRQAFDKTYSESLQMAINEIRYINTLPLTNRKKATAEFNAKMASLSQMIRAKKHLFINPTLPETEFMDKTDPKKFQI